jgi:hypothetical protein
MSAIEAVIEPFTVLDDYRLVDPGASADVTPFPAQAANEAELIAQTLAWCAGQFGVESARLVRPLPTGRWAVLTWRGDGLLHYAADFAEIAMAWNVGLSRAPLIVNRPRVAQRDGASVRPIASKTYVGVPLLCQDQLVGVLEIAGDLKGDLEQRLARALPHLTLVAQRIVHDPALRPRPSVPPTARCALDGAAAFGADIALAPAELRLARALRGAMSLASLAAALNLELETTARIASGLAARGLLAITE